MSSGLNDLVLPNERGRLLEVASFPCEASSELPRDCLIDAKSPGLVELTPRSDSDNPLRGVVLLGELSCPPTLPSLVFVLRPNSEDRFRRGGFLVLLDLNDEEVLGGVLLPLSVLCEIPELSISDSEPILT